MTEIIRALSIRQPYVELILSGKKKLEYRSMPTNLRERVYIYASLQQGGSDKEFRLTGKSFEELPRGAIVGSVEIIDCQYDEKEASFVYKLANPKRIKKYPIHKNKPLPRFWQPKF
jgi:ASCH domain